MSRTMPIVDGYAHAGLPKYPPITDLLMAMSTMAIPRAVLVQQLGQYDNRYIGKAIRQTSGAFAGVALIDPFAANWSRDLREAIILGFRGLRFRAEWLQTKTNVAVAAARAGLHLMIYVDDDMHSCLTPIQRLAREVPTSAIVISHLGAPRVGPSGSPGGRELLDLSAESNVWATLSGFAMFDPHPHRKLAPFIREVIAAFGSRRLMWGSNYPVNADSEPYGLDLKLLRATSWGLDEASASEVVGLTASRLWFPHPDRDPLLPVAGP